jgi:basic membrane lipoprotein Med (substrate-binding protein (PBP1-ABC) superfamily)
VDAEEAAVAAGRNAIVRQEYLLVIAVAAVAAGLVVFMLWPAGAPPRARPYLAFAACLLTDGQGIAGAAARPVWAGMGDASLATRVKVQYLPSVGAVTVEDVRPYLAGLVQRHCDLIVAVGPAQVAAVAADAHAYPRVRFAVVGGASRANVTAVENGPASAVQERVDAWVRAQVGR